MNRSFETISKAILDREHIRRPLVRNAHVRDFEILEIPGIRSARTTLWPPFIITNIWQCPNDDNFNGVCTHGKELWPFPAKNPALRIRNLFKRKKYFGAKICTFLRTLGWYMVWCIVIKYRTVWDHARMQPQWVNSTGNVVHESVLLVDVNDEKWI